MKPDKLAELHKSRDSELNLDALRTPTPVHDDLEKRLLQWIKVARARFETTKIGLSGIMIQTQATKFASEMGKKDFTASKGWLHRFLKRYGFKHINLHGEAGDVDKTKYEEQIAKIREQLEGFDVELIFNMDETGLFFRCFPRGTYVTRAEDAAGVNRKTARGSKAMKAKDRCTVVACCNTTGSLKVPLAVISTAKNPMVFRHIRRSPIPYYSQQSAWLDSTLCQRWFDEVFVPFVKKTTGKKVVLLWDNCPGHKIKNDDPQIIIIFLPPNVTSVFQPMDMGILFALKCQYKTEMVARLADLIDVWDAVRARKIRRGCRGLNDAGQATMLDVTEILSEKWESFSSQTVIRCWLKANILPREHENALKGKDTRLDREDKEDTAIIDDLCEMVSKMSMPASATDSRSTARVLTDNLFVEKASGLTDAEVRQAVKTWLSVEDDPEVLEEEIAMELQAVDEQLAGVTLDDDVPSEEEDDDGRSESCVTTSLTEADVRFRLEECRSFLNAKGKDGEYSETLYLLSRTVHSFTHETQVNRRAKQGGEVQATLGDMWGR
ncbi:unnamed protein product [Ectocarpus sp. CCAP 1310/34]|nr:unnamed protein product [Ectocarpus sp. CCAP 1310/34]